MDYYISENIQYIDLNKNDFKVTSKINDKNFDLIQIVAGIEKVRQVVCYTMGSGEVLVGVLPEPLFSLSERLNLLSTIQKKVSEFAGNKAYVTLDTDLFVAIGKCKVDAKADELKEAITMRNNARM